MYEIAEQMLAEAVSILRATHGIEGLAQMLKEQCRKCCTDESVDRLEPLPF